MRRNLIALLVVAGVMGWAVGSPAQDATGTDKEAMMEAWVKAGTPGEQHAFLVLPGAVAAFSLKAGHVSRSPAVYSKLVARCGRRVATRPPG